MRKFYAAAIAATMLMASCAQEEPGVKIPEGKETKMGMTFSFPGMETRAVVDANATASEKLVVDVTVFIFDTEGAAVTGNATTIGIDKFTETSDNLYSLKETDKIPTTTGARRIYAGMNLPSSMKSFATEAELETAISVVMGDLTKSTGMAMFSEVKEASLFIDETLNVVPVTVERMVAKVGATFGASANGGVFKVDDVTFVVTDFAIGNDATSMYPAKQKDATTGRLLTPGAREEGPTAAEFKAINANGTVATSLNTIYAPENASPTNIRGEVTYAVFRAQFVPDQIATAPSNSISLAVNTTVAPTGANSMEDIWVVKGNEGAYYCKSVSDANDVAAQCTNATIQKYEGSYCYYYVFLNQNEAGKLCELHRNDFIQLEIAGVTGFGSPGKSTEGDGDEPGDGDPEDPELPVVDEPTNLLVNITVKPWNYDMVPGIILEP